MKLFLHIGTEKTGSSFLQTLLALNREQLKQAKIYYPSGGKRENDMLLGNISPGNGKEFFLSIKEEKKNEIKVLLNKFKKNASKRGCDTFLISNENLIEVLSKKHFLELLLETCKELDIELVQILLILRNPVDQALSLYKHRSKNGKAPELEEWINEVYALPIVLKSFFTNLKVDKANYTVRKYHNDTDSMQNIMFKDWLKIDSPQIEVTKRVNPSLTISELSLLKKIGEKNMHWVKPFYEKMLNIPVVDKDKDVTLSSHYKNVIAKKLFSYKEVWVLCNKYLNEKEKLTLPQIVNIQQGEKWNLSFSSIQVDAIIDFFLETKTKNLGSQKAINRIKYRLYNFIKK